MTNFVDRGFYALHWSGYSQSTGSVENEDFKHFKHRSNVGPNDSLG